MCHTPDPLKPIMQKMLPMLMFDETSIKIREIDEIGEIIGARITQKT